MKCPHLYALDDFDQFSSFIVLFAFLRFKSYLRLRPSLGCIDHDVSPFCFSLSEFSWASAEFDLAQIRLIVYQDCEKRGRQVLFDSKAIHKLDASESVSC